MHEKVWVVDDDEGILEVIRMLLEDAGYDVKTSINGKCFQNPNGELPDLILLDVLLPGEDGRDICNKLKKQEQTEHIPVIMLSAHSSASKIASVCGADDFLAKPFDVDVLVDTVEKHLVKK